MLDGGASETAAVADINKDGRLDIVSGENWYEAPTWTRHHFRDLGFSGNYIDGFSDMPVDVDGDGYPDIASVTWFAKKISWFRNPGKAGGAWVEAPINSGFNIEFATLADLDNDGKALEIDRRLNALPALPAAGLWLEDRGVRVPRSLVQVTPRIGVDYACPIWSGKHWRFTFDAQALPRRRLSALSAGIAVPVRLDGRRPIVLLTTSA